MSAPVPPPCPDSVRPATPFGYSPALLQRAYSLPSGRGSGRTVAIVDAYDDPNAESDLATYRRTYGLPSCTTANGCFRKVNQNGGTSYPSADSGWAAEISLDLDMVSAICPNCHILLVEASSSEHQRPRHGGQQGRQPRREVRVQQLRRGRVVLGRQLRPPVLQPPRRGDHGVGGGQRLRHRRIPPRPGTSPPSAAPR